MRELHFTLKNSAWVNLINFTKEGSNNYKYVIAKLLFFEQGVSHRGQFLGKNTFLIIVRGPWKEGIVTLTNDKEL